uniref:Uncharacterized protein n=1 Tax=Lygus hesperus TaxID=30085 RepID=A0A146M2P4_LYGHE
MQPSTGTQIKRNTINEINEQELRELQQPLREIDFEHLLILSAHAARTCSSPSTVLTKPLPNSYIKPPAPHLYSPTLSRLPIGELYAMVREKKFQPNTQHSSNEV